MYVQDNIVKKKKKSNDLELNSVLLCLIPCNFSHEFVFNTDIPALPWLQSRQAFVHAASDPPSHSQWTGWVGTLLFLAVTIKHVWVLATILLRAAAAVFPLKHLTGNNYKLVANRGLHASESRRQTGVHLMAFKAEEVMKDCYLSRQQRRGMVAWNAHKVRVCVCVCELTVEKAEKVIY